MCYGLNELIKKEISDGLTVTELRDGLYSLGMTFRGNVILLPMIITRTRQEMYQHKGVKIVDAANWLLK